MAERRRLKDAPRHSGDVRIQSEGSDAGTPDAAHELTDARVGPLFKFLVALGVLLAVALVVTGSLMLRMLERDQ
jgi:hypothetical protein